MNNIEIIHKLLTDLEGRSVTIVGGNLESAPEEFLTDYVAWTNNHWLRRKDSPPIDFLFHCLGPRAPVSQMLTAMLNSYKLIVGPSWAIGRNDVEEWSVRYARPFLSFDWQDSSAVWWQKLDNLVTHAGGNSPLTGLVAAWFFHLMPVQRVYLTGMNLYQGQELSAGTAGHNPKAQAAVFDYILRVDKRFEADEVMTKAIQELVYGREKSDAEDARVL